MGSSVLGPSLIIAPGNITAPINANIFFQDKEQTLLEMWHSAKD